MTAPSADLGRRIGLDRANPVRADRRIEPDRQLGGDVPTEPIGDRVEPILQRHAVGQRESRDLGHHHRGTDAVLVERTVRHEVAERLLVAEHEPQVGTFGDDLADPLEPGERLLACTPAASAMRPSSDDDTIVVTTSRSSPVVLARM